MAIKRVIVHLGMSKAGSSSIQHTLFNNASILEKNGFRYLTEWGVNHLYILHNLFSQCSPCPNKTRNRDKTHSFKMHKNMNKHNINTMLKVINTTECETLILSGEYSSELSFTFTIENIKAFLKKYFHDNKIETTIIFIVRNPLTWAISSLQHKIYHSSLLTTNNVDFFEFAINIYYDGVMNLKNHFSESLILLKFEEACLDDNGLTGGFLKALDFPGESLSEFNTSRQNESRCMEAMEFKYYIEAAEPLFVNSFGRLNPNRRKKELASLRNIKGAKFDLSYQSKVELWKRFQSKILLLKENTGIDYTDYKITPTLHNQETYSEETVQGFIDIFPKLSIVLQKHFLKFFEKKYMETAQEKFKPLHFKDSIPWKAYKQKNTFLCLLNLRIKNTLIAMTPSKYKRSLMRIWEK